MADMTVEEAMEKYGPGELTRDELLEFDDPTFNPRTSSSSLVLTL